MGYKQVIECNGISIWQKKYKFYIQNHRPEVVSIQISEIVGEEPQDSMEVTIDADAKVSYQFESKRYQLVVEDKSCVFDNLRMGYRMDF